MLVAISFNADSASQAEKLCDFIYFLSGKVQSGSCLLVCSNETHPEHRLKVQLAAEVAFENVDLITGQNSITAAAEKVKNSYKGEWLYLESDCVPLVKDWREKLKLAYDSQPKKILGSHLKVPESGDIFLGKFSIYPNDFNEASDKITASTKTKLIQYGLYSKREDVRKDAVLFCSDKSGDLIKVLREELK